MKIPTEMPRLKGYRLIESGDVAGGLGQQSTRDTLQYGVDRTEGAVTYLPGSEIPNYTLHPPVDLNVLPGSTTVDSPTPLSDLLEPGMGCVNWAACTEVDGPGVVRGAGGYEP